MNIKLHTKSMYLSLLIALMMGTTILIDLQYPAEVIINVFYIGVITLSFWLPKAKHILWVTLLCSLALIGGYYFSPNSLHPWHALIDTSLMLIALWLSCSMLVFIKKIYQYTKASKVKQQAMFNALLDPILMISNQGVILEAHARSNYILGWAPQELTNRPIYALLSSPYETQYKKYCEHPHGFNTIPYIGTKQEIIAKNKAGQELSCEFVITQLRLPEQSEPMYMIIIRDTSDQKKIQEKLLWLSTHDELTGIYNRRYFNDQINEEWRRLMRERTPLCLLLVDIDHFKAYNDSLGHQAGDECLRNIVVVINEQFNRAGEFLARYGGEEFAILLPNTDREGCHIIAERILKAVREESIPHPNSHAGALVTVSIGGACMVPTPTFNSEILIKMADQALYEAKDNGRDCFILQGEKAAGLDLDSKESML